MSKELKHLIDTIDSTNRAHSDLEKMIKFLKDEVQRLTFTINEQKKVIQNQSVKLSSIKDNNLPTDILVLKEMVMTQREEIVKKDKDIEILKKTLEEITTELEETKPFKEDEEELIYAQKSIIQLTEENEILNQKIRELQQIIASRKNDEFGDKDQQLIDAKKLLFQLTEESGIKSVKIESLKADNHTLTSELEEQTILNQQLREDLELSNYLNEKLDSELNEVQEKVDYLQEKLDKFSNYQQDSPKSPELINQINNLNEKVEMIEEENINLKNIIGTNINVIENLKRQNDELSGELQNHVEIENDLKIQSEKEREDLTQKLLTIENTNQQLNDLINELREKEQKVNNVPALLPPLNQNMQKNVERNLFRFMFNLLDDESKIQVKELLMKDLRSESRELRTYAIKTLSIIKDKEILNELKTMISDEDWIVKLYLIKAFTKFSKEEVKDTLEKLKRDRDPDVRESADRLLSKLNCA